MYLTTVVLIVKAMEKEKQKDESPIKRDRQNAVDDWKAAVSIVMTKAENKLPKEFYLHVKSCCAKTKVFNCNILKKHLQHTDEWKEEGLETKFAFAKHAMCEALGDLARDADTSFASLMKEKLEIAEFAAIMFIATFCEEVIDEKIMLTLSQSISPELFNIKRQKLPVVT